MTFRVGQLVVCVGEFKSIGPHEIGPRIGEIYTVRDIEFCEKSQGFYIRLDEILNPELFYYEGFGECQFSAKKFRPLSQTSTDLFNALLLTKPGDIPADDVVEVGNAG